MKMGKMENLSLRMGGSRREEWKLNKFGFFFERKSFSAARSMMRMSD
jgi:hypothetical protein